MTLILTRSFTVDPRRPRSALAERRLPVGPRGGFGPAIDDSVRAESERRQDFGRPLRSQEAPNSPFEANGAMPNDACPVLGRFDRSIPPDRGRGQGRPEGSAEPVHAVARSGLDVDCRLSLQKAAAERLVRELASAGYWPAPIVLGPECDPYRPVEGQYGVTRSLIEALRRTRHPLSIVTQSNLILRDLDILGAMGRDGLVKTFVSLPTLDREIARRLEPDAPSPESRLEAIEALNDAGAPAGVMISPIIPAITDSEIETILTRAHAAGAREAGYIIKRTPPDLRDPLRERLLAHYPDKLRRAVSLMQAMVDAEDAGGGGGQAAGLRAYDWMVRRRFETAARRLGYRETPAPLRTDLFRRPARSCEETRAEVLVG